MPNTRTLALVRLSGHFGLKRRIDGSVYIRHCEARLKHWRALPAANCWKGASNGDPQGHALGITEVSP